MSKVFIEESTLSSIGSAIRSKTGGQDLISPLDMAKQIEGIAGGMEINGNEIMRLNIGSEAIEAGDLLSRKFIVEALTTNETAITNLGYSCINLTELASDTFLFCEPDSTKAMIMAKVNEDNTITFTIKQSSFGQSVCHNGDKVGFIRLSDTEFIVLRNETVDHWLVTTNEEHTEFLTISKITSSGNINSTTADNGFCGILMENDLIAVLEFGSSTDGIGVYQFDKENLSMTLKASWAHTTNAVSATKNCLIPIGGNRFIYFCSSNIYTLDYTEGKSTLTQPLPAITISGGSSGMDVVKYSNDLLFVNTYGTTYWLYNTITQEIHYVGNDKTIYQTGSTPLSSSSTKCVTIENGVTAILNPNYVRWGLYDEMSRSGLYYGSAFTTTLSSSSPGMFVQKLEEGKYKLVIFCSSGSSTSSKSYYKIFLITIGVEKTNRYSSLVGVAQENIEVGQKGVCYEYIGG